MIADASMSRDVPRQINEEWALHPHRNCRTRRGTRLTRLRVVKRRIDAKKLDVDRHTILDPRQ